MSEIHLIIVWEHASHQLNEIIKDIQTQFTIKKVLQVSWSQELFSVNLTRFYGQNLPIGCDKETHIGNGPFFAIIFSDATPEYDIRPTTKGDLSVNAKVFDAKQRYREWTGGGHKVHGTNTEQETLHDLWLLLGQEPKDFLSLKKWSGEVEARHCDLLGTGGWKNIEELFASLNLLCNYIVLRNFEPLPNQYLLASHGDIDLLVDDLERCIHIAGGIKLFPGENRVHYGVKIGDQTIPFDFRYVGDDYYDASFQKDLLARREFIKDCYFAPERKDYFYSLLYHALIHKPEFSEEYSSRLMVIGEKSGIEFDGTAAMGKYLLDRYCYQQGYAYVRPIDITVFYNEPWVSALPDPYAWDTDILQAINSASDLSPLSLALRRYDGLAPNILRPFDAMLHGHILQIGAASSAITRYLADCSKSLWVLEPNSAFIKTAQARTRDLTNLSFFCEYLDQFHTSQKFDVITLIGVLEYASLHVKGENSALMMLARARALLKPNGILIVASESQFGLKYFAGTPSTHSSKPMYTIEGRGQQGNQHQSFSRASLVKLLEDAGFMHSEFLAPFPDHIRPVSILTERGIAHPTFDASALAWQNVGRDSRLPESPLFALELTWPEVFKGKLALEMANSFLVLAGATDEPLDGPRTLGYHYSTERLPEFCKETRFTETEAGDIVVAYRRLVAGSNHTSPHQNHIVSSFVPESVPYISGRLLSRELLELLHASRWTEGDVRKFTHKYLAAILALTQGTPFSMNEPLRGMCLPGKFFDLLPQNIIEKETGQFAAFDCEWVSNDEITIEFLLFRGLFVSLGGIRQCAQPEDDRLLEWKYFIQQVAANNGLPIVDEQYAAFITKEIEFREAVTGESSGTAEILMGYRLAVRADSANWERALAERDTAIHEREAAITGHETVRAERDIAIHEREAAIADRETVRAERDIAIHEREAAIAARDLALSERDLITSELDVVAAERVTLATTLDTIHHSASWRLTRPLRFAARTYRYGITREDRLKLSQAIRRRYHRLPIPAPLKQAVRFAYHRVLRKAVRSMLHATARTPELRSPSPGPSAQREKDYFIWGVIDWHFRHQRPQQLALALTAKGRRVFYISSNLVDDERAGFEVEALDHSHQLFQIKLFAKGAPSIYSNAPGLEVVTQLNLSIGEVLAWADCQQIIALVQHPFWYDIAAVLPNSRLIYDCMDHHQGFGNNGESLLQLEHRLLREAELTITTSAWLDEVVATHTPHHTLIRNAGDYEHFATAPKSIYQDPQGRRVIGYYGAIAEWFDLELVAAVAQQHPDCSLLLLGADTVNARSWLEKLPNVSFTGEIPYRELPYYLYGFDVCLLPFKVAPITLATNPVKIYEYLSAGKPVVTVDLPEMAQFDELVYPAADKEAFLAALQAILRQGEPDTLIQRRQIFAQGQTWEHRTQALIQHAESGTRDAKVSVVVVTYNNIDLTRACLDSLDRYSQYPHLEIIVVDNASSDGSSVFLTKWAAKQRCRKLILNSDNRGFAAANNQGLAAATGDYLVLLNNDTYVTPGWIRSLLKHLRRDKTIGLIGPVTNNIGNEAKIDIAYNDMDDMLLKSAAYTRRHIGQTYPLRTAAFFCVMMPRTTYERVGSLDEAFGRGFFEDDDYCRRVEQLGLRVVCAEDVFIHHHLSASFNKLNQQDRQKLFEDNKKVYEAKWGEWVPHGYRAHATGAQDQEEVIPEVLRPYKQQ